MIDEKQLQEWRKLADEATPITVDTMMVRYDHGGGRMYLEKGLRQLVLDVYNESNREFYFAARSAVLALLDEVARLNARKVKLLKFTRQAEIERDEYRLQRDILLARVEHLTALVKSTEWKSDVETCSACGVDKLPHLPTCRVFTADGGVR